MKEFNGNGKTFTVAQVQVMDTTDLLDQKQVLINALEKLRADNDYIAAFLMITSIIDEATNLIYAGNMDGVVSKAFEKDVLSSEVYLPGVMSRKKQVIPQILSAL
ncbi:MAG: manganese-dependent inorganic pyrophosphatase, partial [Megasphaera micronuciformis]|nr:manganese-dependent inorganic pyrophosphatase [Megasphaera micronuciformis]